MYFSFFSLFFLQKIIFPARLANQYMTTHNHTHDHLGKMYQNIKTTTLPESKVEIEGEITAEALAHFREHALKHFQEKIDIPGFRKGKVPEKIAVERVGELALLEEAGELALQSAYEDILKEVKIDPIGSPTVAITKLALGNPMHFKITTAVYPEFTLPDYKKIAKEVSGKQESVSVSEKEIEEAVNTIRRLQAQKSATDKIKDEDLPPLTEELVKTFGKFENLDDFKVKLHDSLTKEKELRNKEKNRLTIIKGILEKSEIPLPRLLVEGELDRMLAKMKDDIERMGAKMPDYLKQIGKTEDDLRKEWEKDAKERASMELILDKIAKLENISATSEEIEQEIKHLLEHYQDADPIRASSYFEHIIRNEKVFQFLESQR